MKFAGKLPEGLTVVSRVLIEKPAEMHVAVCLFNTGKTVVNYDSGETEPVAHIRHAEVILDPEDRALIERIFLRAQSRRGGQQVLPMDLEDDVREAFRGLSIDLATGEVRGLDEDGEQA